jgi:hypothetical protein
MWNALLRRSNWRIGDVLFHRVYCAICFHFESAKLTFGINRIN